MAKIQISTSNRVKKNRHYLPTTTVLTQDVAQIAPINILPTTPGDVFNIDLNMVSQSVPTAVKTFGAFHLRTFAFFVPHRVVFPRFEDYIARSADSSIDTRPFNFSWYNLMREVVGISLVGSSSSPELTFISSKYVYQTTNSVCDFDFSSWASDDSEYTGRFNFTAKGRALMKILQGVGYEIPKKLLKQASTSEMLYAILNYEYDALPLLSFGRFFYDYVYPSSYVTQQGFGFLFDGVAQMSVTEWLPKLLDLFFVPMEQDFFTSLWLRPNSKALGSGAQDVGSQTFSLDSNPNNNLYVSSSPSRSDVSVRQNSTSQSDFTLSASSLRWLESISDFVIRNNIGGTRFHEWMKAHFGFVTAPEDSVRSVFLKASNDSLNFSGVVANTGTETQLLGDRAGIGNCQGSMKLKFEAKEHGFLIFASMVVPSTAYYQGTKPWCRKISSPFDFYTPELDSVDMAPVPYSAVFSSYDRAGVDELAIQPTRLNDAFGFAPRYAEKYKVGWSFLNGDFRLGSRNVGKDAYHTFRNVLYGRDAQHRLGLDAQFLQADNQYNRIYAVAPEASDMEQLQDKIESIYLFNTVKYSSQLSIGDSMPIFDKSGRDVNIENGGTQI